MQFSVFKKLSDALKNNESRYFGEILDENFDEIEDLSDDSEVNIYHKFATSIVNEKYLFQFLDKLNQVITKKFSKKAIEVLLNSASTVDEKQTPLHQAIVQGKAKIAMNYLEMGADPRLCNGEGRNCLHLCSQSGLIGLFMHLLEMYQMDIMCMDSSMFTPLHIAISERREEMALLIISLSPKIDIENESGKSVLALAVDLGSYRITRHLLLNKVNKPNYTANVLEIEGKCEDRDILKLLKNPNSSKSSPKWFILLLFIVIMKESYIWASLLDSGIVGHGLTEFLLFYAMPFTFFLVSLALLIASGLKNPGFKEFFQKGNLIELYSIYNPEYVCPYCKMKKSKTTRHCVICKICVKAHDHHCKWINNCIGRANYRVFISFLVFLIISVVCDTSILILHLQNQLETYGILSQYSGTFIEIACLIMNSGILIIVLPIVYKQVKGYQRPKSRPQKCYKVKSTDLSKILQTRTIDSTSDTDSMFIRDSYDSNSEISSKTSSLSQLFPSS